MSHLEETGYVRGLKITNQDNSLIAYDSVSNFGTVAVIDSKIVEILSGYSIFEDPKSGEFSKISIHQDELTGESDFSGSCPIFYGTSRNAVVISNDVHAIAIFLGISEMSKNSMVEMIKYGHCIGRETTINGVFRIWPEEKLRLSRFGGKFLPTIEKYDALNYTKSSKLMTNVEDAYNVLLKDIEKIPIDLSNSICQISGGLDSRLTVRLLTLSKISQLNTLNIAFSDIEESKIAAQVAAAVNANHTSISLATDNALAARKAWLLTSGQVGVNAAAGNLIGYDYVKSRQLNVIIGGWQGDCLIGSYVPNYAIFINPRFRRLAVRNWVVNRGYPNDEILIALDGILKRRDLRKARKRLLQVVNDIHAFDAAQQLSWWGMFRRQPAFTNISPARLCSDLIEVTPLLGKNYVGELLKLKGIDLLDKNFYRKLIHGKFPELRHISYSYTGVPISGEYDYSKNRLGFKRIIFTFFPSSYLLERYSKIKARLNSKKVNSPVVSLEAKKWCEELSVEDLGKQSKNAAMKIHTEINNLENLSHYLGVLTAIEWTRKYLQDTNLAE
jgi:hypothetical protein